MNKKLYVGNLSASVTDEDLKSNFAQCGTVVSVNVVKDRYTGASRGFGFVEMETAEAAQAAITKFNGGQLDGNTIVVSEARPKRDEGREGGGRRGPSFGGPRRPGGGGGFRSRY